MDLVLKGVKYNSIVTRYKYRIGVLLTCNMPLPVPQQEIGIFLILCLVMNKLILVIKLTI